MNLDEIKNISIKSYLESINCKQVSEKGYYGMYIAPYRKDSKASLRVNYNDNLWYDYGIGKGGSIIDMIMVINGCSFKEALALFENGIIAPNSFSFHRKELIKCSPTITIKKVKALENVALLEYLTSRKIDISVAKYYCNEIYYEVDAKPYFAIGFMNLSNGYEL